MRAFLIMIFAITLTSLVYGQMTNRLDKLDVNDLNAKKLTVQSTTVASKPCPAMSEAQRDALASLVEGQCVFNTDTKALNVYDSTSWVPVGSGEGGGISDWETGKLYQIGDVVIEDTKIYQANTQHTSTSFASDLANWTLISGVVLDEATGTLNAELIGLGTVDNTELDYLDGVTSNVQDQLDSKGVEITGAASTIVSTDLTASRAAISNASGKVDVSSVTTTELGYLSGADSNIQDQIDGKEPSFSVLPLSKGGSNKALSANNGAVAYSDADSLELLAPGTAGQILQSNGAAAPSFVNKSISAKAQNGSSVTIEEVQAINNQLTQVDTNKHLIESGNKNILVNPSFEHSTFSTGWTNSAGTFTEETVNEIHGLKSAKLVLSSQAMELSQDSTLYASQFADGVQGLVSVMLKSDVALKVCSRSAGITSTSNCVDVQANNKWALYKVPMILGGTSNGIAIVSSGAVSGTVFIDDAFVGAVDLVVDFDSTKYLGQVVYGAGASGSSWRTYSGVGAISTDSEGFTYNDATKEINLIEPGDYKLDYYVAYSTSTAGMGIGAGIVINGVTEQCTEISLGGADTGPRPKVTCNLKNLPANSKIILRHYTSSAVAGSFAVVEVIKFGSSSIYSSPSADFNKIGEVVWTASNSIPDGFIPANNVSIGNSGATYSGSTYYALYEVLWSMPGISTTAGHPFVISSTKGASALADWAANKTITIDFATNEVFVRQKGAARDLGSYQADENKSHTHAENVGVASGSFLRWVGVTGTGASISGATSGTGWSSTTSNRVLTDATGGTETRPKNVALNAYIRYLAENKLLVAQLSGLEKCTDSYECTDTFSAKVTSAGVVYEENIDWINGNCSVSGTAIYTCNLKTDIATVPMNCVVNTQDSDFFNFGSMRSMTSTQVVYNTHNYTGTAQATAAVIVCQKQGADYTPKSARAVASDQNVRSIGAVGVDIQSVSFGSGANCATSCSTSPCTICNQVGTKITSVSRTGAGIYRVNGIDGLKYSCTGSGTTNGYIGLAHIRNNSTSSYAEIQSGNLAGSNADSANNSLICIGIP